MKEDFWTDEVKEQFRRAYEANKEDAGDERFMHTWYQDDGIFCIPVE